MDEIESRLVACFQNVFPDLPREAVLRASQETLPAWDSVAAVTLVNVIEEEFGIAMDFEELAELHSFDRVYEHCRRRQVG
jgi:acyl carrier protein